jgi:hypothetical protein
VTDPGFPAASSSASNVYSGVIKMMWQQPASDRWALSSIAYKRIDDNMYLKVRSGEYKGNGSSSATLSTAADAYYDSGELNPTRSQTSNDGTTPWYWNGNFIRFTAKYSVTDLTGIYSAAWVAGVGEEDARIFNLKMENNTSLAGAAFFGFGSPVQDPNFDGLVSKFYCNWTAVGGANGGNSDADIGKGRISGSQYQTFALQSSGIWLPTVNNIRFAPTRSCGKTGVIDTAGTRGFKYSRNWDSGTNAMSTTLSDTVDTYELLGKGSYSTYLDRVKATLGWTSTNLVP